MAPVVDVKTIFDGDKRLAVRLTSEDDGVGETAVVKVDASTFTSFNEPVTHFSVEEIEWNVQDYSSVKLEWDATSNDVIDILSGSGYKDYRSFGGGMIDPQSAGSTGDIVITTAGQTAISTYDITLHLRKRIA